MCGITGILLPQRELAAPLIRAMTDALRHRGPDDEGYLAFDLARPNPEPLFGPESTITSGEKDIRSFERPGTLFLGHRRLSILDLSSAGRQPMSLGDRLWIVFNGEIYNFIELRDELSAKGYRFETGTDTEVILAAYDAWDEDCVSRFNGDWAFCILDLKRSALFFSRDRYGIKPLYCADWRGGLAFASEIKALFTLPGVGAELHPEVLRDYFLFALSDHRREAIFSGIWQLMPGENLFVDLTSGEKTFRRYYRVPERPPLRPYDDTEARKTAERLRELLFDAVRIRLRADVPVGTGLSGGLDSSTVTAVIASQRKRSGECQYAFTASFPGLPIDETPYAERVGRHFGIEPHRVFPDGEKLRNDLSRMFFHLEQPVIDTGIYTQWAIHEKASEHVKVIIDGEGGDEALAGYRNYRISFAASLLRSGRLLALAREIWGTLRNTKGEIWGIPQILFYSLGPAAKASLYEIRRTDPFKEFSRKLPEGGREIVSKMFSSDIGEILEMFLVSSSLPHLLRYEDRCSMAHSIEARVPFTDYRIIELAYSIPATFLIHKGWTKWLLRLAMEGILPDDIVWRGDKLGYATPRWQSRSELWTQWNRWRVHGFGEGARALPTRPPIRALAG